VKLWGSVVRDKTLLSCVQMVADSEANCVHLWNRESLILVIVSRWFSGLLASAIIVTITLSSRGKLRFPAVLPPEILIFSSPQARVTEITWMMGWWVTTHRGVVAQGYESYSYVIFSFPVYIRAGIAQSVQRLTTGWTVPGSHPGGVGYFPHSG